MLQPDLFARPVVERPAAVHVDAVFSYGGAMRRVHRVYGTDARAPVIVEELGSFGSTHKGQYALWSYEAIARCLAKGSTP